MKRLPVQTDVSFSDFIRLNLGVLGQILFVLAAFVVTGFAFVLGLYLLLGLAAIVLIVTAIISAGSFLNTLREWYLLKTGIRTQATVIDEMYDALEEEKIYKIRYTDRQGKVHEGYCSQKKAGPGLKAGDEFEIIFNSRKPKSFIKASIYYDE